MDIFAYSTFFLKYKGNQKGLTPANGISPNFYAAL